MRRLKFQLRHIPNVLSIIRILLVFVFLYLALAKEDLIAALIVFLVAGATDVVDGFLARKNNWVSDLGKVLDPFADKLMQCTVLVVLCLKDIIPIWFVIPFFIKEISTLVAGALVIKKRNVVVVSRWYGKAAVCVFYATIAASIVYKDFLAANPIIYVAIFLPAIGFAIGAFAGYIKHYYVLKDPDSDLSKCEKIQKI